MKKSTRLCITAQLLLLAFLLFTIAVMGVDVRPIGPRGSTVGLAGLNEAAREIFGVHTLWYDVTKYLGAAILLLAAGMALLGLGQLLRRRSLGRVDRPILCLAGLYVLLGAVYLFFEHCVINYRPLLLETELEASYPSSHTMLAVCILFSALPELHRLAGERRGLRFFADALAVVLAAVMVVGRLLSGVHWCTDILGGVLLSAALCVLYCAVLCRWEEPQG